MKINDLDKLLKEGKTEEVADLILESLEATEDREPEAVKPEVENEDLYNKESEPVAAEEVKEVVVENEEISEDVMEVEPAAVDAVEDGSAEVEDLLSDDRNAGEIKDNLNVEDEVQENIEDAKEKIDEEHPELEKAMDVDAQLTEELNSIFNILKSLNEEKEPEAKTPELDNEDLYNKESEPVDAEEVKDVDLDNDDVYPEDEHDESVDLSAEDIVNEAIYQYKLYNAVNELNEGEFNIFVESVDEDVLEDVEIVLSEEYSEFADSFNNSLPLNESEYDLTGLLEGVIYEGLLSIVNEEEKNKKEKKGNVALGAAVGAAGGSVAPELVQKGIDAVKNNWSSIKGTASNVATNVGNAASNVATNVGNAASNAATNVGNAASNAGNAIGNAAKNAWSSIKGAASNVGAGFKDAGVALANPYVSVPLGLAGAGIAAGAAINKARKVSKARQELANTKIATGDVKDKDAVEAYAKGRRFGIGRSKYVIDEINKAKKEYNESIGKGNGKKLTREEKRARATVVKNRKIAAKGTFKKGKTEVLDDIKSSGIGKTNHKGISAVAKDRLRRNNSSAEEPKDEEPAEQPKDEEKTPVEKPSEEPKNEEPKNEEKTPVEKPSEEPKNEEPKDEKPAEQPKDEEPSEEPKDNEKRVRSPKIIVTPEMIKLYKNKNKSNMSDAEIAKRIRATISSTRSQQRKRGYKSKWDNLKEAVEIVLETKLYQYGKEVFTEAVVCAFDMLNENRIINESMSLSESDITGYAEMFYEMEIESKIAEKDLVDVELDNEDIYNEETEPVDAEEVEKPELENKDIYCDVMHKQVEDVVAVVVEAAKLCKEAGVAGTIENITEMAKSLFESEEVAVKVEKPEHEPEEQEYDVDAAIESSEMNGNDEKFEEYEEIQGEGADAAKSEDLKETVKYTSLKEACSLDEDYFVTDTYSIQTAEEKQDRLTEQVSLLLAREAMDPMYDELLKSSVYCKRLQEALLEKYYTEAASRTSKMVEKRTREIIKIFS